MSKASTRFKKKESVGLNEARRYLLEVSPQHDCLDLEST